MLNIHCLGRTSGKVWACTPETGEIGALLVRLGQAVAKTPGGFPRVHRIHFSTILITCCLVVPHFAFGACDLNATTANFGSQLAAAQPGQTLCLASGSYGDF